MTYKLYTTITIVCRIKEAICNDVFKLENSIEVKFEIQYVLSIVKISGRIIKEGLAFEKRVKKLIHILFRN